MNLKKSLMYKKKISIYFILFSLFVSILVSEYNLKNYDKNILKEDGKSYHQMIKTDPHRYLSEGYEIKKQWKKGVFFFKSGPENYTKYLPSRIAAIYYYIFDYKFYDNETEKKNLKIGIHNFYLFFQCLFYFLSVYFFSNQLFLKIKNNFTSNVIIIFLCIEPTLFQYHGSFWSESYFFSFQLLLLTFMLKPPNFKNLMFVGIFLGILALQKQLAFFYIIPISLYYMYFIKEKKISKVFFIFLFYFLVLSVLGLNNLGRTGKFYILTADTKIDLHLDLIEKVMVKKKNISRNEFRIQEGKAMKNWMVENKIILDKSLIDLKKDYTYWEYRSAIINEKDKEIFDKEISKRTINYLQKYPIDFTKFIIKSAIHTVLLNPFHIFSENNFESGEIYYLTDQHDNLVYFRIPYTLSIYLVCLLGFFSLIRKKKYDILILYIISIIYFYSLVLWHGNTRYFMPNLIYLSLFFGYGILQLNDFLNLKLKKKLFF